MITEKQREERQKYLGSSDIAALFIDKESGKSFDLFKNATDVWTQKVYDLKKADESKAMSRGNRYESALIKYAEQELGLSIETDPGKMRFICEEHPIFAANLDGFTIEKNPVIVEVKTTSLGGEWDEPDSDHIPPRVIFQVHLQMLCTGWNKAHVVVLLGRYDRLCEEMYVVERDERIINAIIERGTQFWNDYVLTKTPPPDSEPGGISLFKRIARVPEKYAEMDTDIIAKWDELRLERLSHEKLEKAALAEVLKNLGDAEAAKTNDGREFTYFTQSRTGLDNRKLRAEYPDAFNNCQKTSTFPVPKIRKVK